MQVKKKIIIFLSALVVTAGAVFHFISQSMCETTRYSFDFGSGAIKVKSAVVNKCEKHIVAEKLEYAESNQIIKCIINHKQEDNLMPKQCITELLTAVKSIEKKYNISCKTSNCAGVATAWARKIDNGQEVMDILAQEGIKTQLISQTIEGDIGFFNAIADNETKHVSPKNIVTWDIGAGSFQLSTLDDNGNVHVYNGPAGIESYDHVMREAFGISPLSSKPYLDEETLPRAFAMVEENLGKSVLSDEIIARKLKDPKTVVFAIGRPMSLGLRKNMNSSAKPDIVEINNLAHQYIDKSIDDIITNTFKEMPQEIAVHGQSIAIILGGIMKGAGIEKIEIIDSPINDYILVENKFWN